MKKPSIWLFSDYKDYLRQLIEDNKDLSGFRSRLAKGSGCQRSFLSQALNGPVHLTLDHGAQLSDYLHLTQIERDYFLELLTYARAGSTSLQKISLEKINRLKNQATDVAKRVKLGALPKGLAEALYYSSWHFAAVHSCLAIPDINSVSQIADLTNIPSKEVLKALEKLEEIGLVENQKSQWKLTSQSIHLPKDSPYSAVNQFNWRQKAIQKLQSHQSNGVHYTGLFVLSKQAKEQIHNLLLDSIERTHQIVTTAECEELVVFNCDFFEL